MGNSMISYVTLYGTFYNYTWLPFENASIFSFNFGSVNTSRLDLLHNIN